MSPPYGVCVCVCVCVLDIHNSQFPQPVFSVETCPGLKCWGTSLRYFWMVSAFKWGVLCKYEGQATSGQLPFQSAGWILAAHPLLEGVWGMFWQRLTACRHLWGILRTSLNILRLPLENLAWQIRNSQSKRVKWYHKAHLGLDLSSLVLRFSFNARPPKRGVHRVILLTFT